MQKTGAGKPWDTMQRQKKTTSLWHCAIYENIYDHFTTRIVEYSEIGKLLRAQWPKNPRLTDPLPILRSLQLVGQGTFPVGREASAARWLTWMGRSCQWWRPGMQTDRLLPPCDGCKGFVYSLGSFVTKDCDLGCSWHFFRRKTEKPNTSGGLTMVVQQLCL